MGNEGCKLATVIAFGHGITTTPIAISKRLLQLFQMVDLTLIQH